MTSHLLAAGFEAKRAIEEGGANGNSREVLENKFMQILSLRQVSML